MARQSNSHMNVEFRVSKNFARQNPEMRLLSSPEALAYVHQLRHEASLVYFTVEWKEERRGYVFFFERVTDDEYVVQVDDKLYYTSNFVTYQEIIERPFVPYNINRVYVKMNYDRYFNLEINRRVITNLKEKGNVRYGLRTFSPVQFLAVMGPDERLNVESEQQEDLSVAGDDGE